MSAKNNLRMRCLPRTSDHRATSGGPVSFDTEEGDPSSYKRYRIVLFLASRWKVFSGDDFRSASVLDDGRRRTRCESAGRIVTAVRRCALSVPPASAHRHQKLDRV